MPINKKYPIRDLFEVLKKYPLEHGRRITFEYVLIDGVNDSLDHARELLKLLKLVPNKVNLLMFNEFEGTIFKQPSRATAKEFQEFLVRSGIQTNLRESKGGEISAACGQLATKN
jgi:23S rRNA (adenine2503-C2)-methyltransferase